MRRPTPPLKPFEPGCPIEPSPTWRRLVKKPIFCETIQSYDEKHIWTLGRLVQEIKDGALKCGITLTDETIIDIDPGDSYSGDFDLSVSVCEWKDEITPNYNNLMKSYRSLLKEYEKKLVEYKVRHEEYLMKQEEFDANIKVYQEQETDREIKELEKRLKHLKKTSSK